MAFGTTFIPENLQWWGIGREAVPGTAVAPTISIPVDKGQPDDKITYIQDKSIQGDMSEDHGDIAAVGIADFPLQGNVYLDTIGHLLYNFWGDYTATGSTPTNSTTLNGAVTAGATTCTVTSGTGYSIGQAVQIGVSGDGNPEIVVLTNVVTTTLTFANTPLRFSHASGKAVSTVVAPFTHIFSALNSGTGQPPTHTLTYHNALAASVQARQYAYWVSTGMDFTMNPEQLFKHDTKGISVVGVIPGVAPSNSQSGITAVPDWQFKIGVGGPATGGTQLINVEDCAVNLVRGNKAKYTLQGVQTPWAIPRLGITATGKFVFTAQDESPLTQYLADTIQQLQITMSQGSGASTLGITYDFQTCKYETSTIAAPDVLTYEVNWRAYGNTTNAGFSGAKSPGKVTLVNAVPTY